MERRREHRFCHRMSCQLNLNDRRYQGLVLDVSRSGLFVQTRAKAPGRTMAPVTVALRSTASDEALTLSAMVARQYWVPDQLVALAKGGVGLRVIGNCAAWLELLDDLAERKQLVLVGREAMRPLRPVTATRCGECGREGTTLWSGSCGWCSGNPPHRRSDRAPSGR